MWPMLKATWLLVIVDCFLRKLECYEAVADNLPGRILQEEEIAARVEDQPKYPTGDDVVSPLLV
jgi:hypothetical protein